jgi:hypothetical protein
MSFVNQYIVLPDHISQQVQDDEADDESRVIALPGAGDVNG